MELFRGYTPRKAMDNATVEETIDKLHMAPPQVSKAIRDVAQQLKENRDMKFREYKRLWELRRSEAFEKVLAKVQQHRDFQINVVVYRWRPAESKLSACWDGPWRIMELLGKTRVILCLIKDPVIQSYESVINLKIAKSYDDSVSASDDENDHWVECTRCGYDDEESPEPVDESEVLPTPIKQLKGSMRGCGSLE
ncbi:hypothetical protein FOL47_007363 [Perkinsus chesapeaki]|uniref:Uncharacterized protein n=1 Tax=Perkinsus chesapeaki TaxID=330153 RepID=A0A7J6LL30_PERCH|nr:hypothetical protein FOL47_007363 [Perkinsus chesapeaki]